MSLSGEAPFTPSPGSITHIGTRLTELGVTPSDCQVIGANALYLQGLVEHPGRTDLVVGEEVFDAIGGRLFATEDLIAVAEENEVAANDWMVYFPRGLRSATAEQVHVFSRFVAEHKFDLGDEVTFNSLARLAQPAHGFNTIDPVASLNWLMARGLRSDQSVALAGLRSLRGLKLKGVGRLSDRASWTWPDGRSRAPR